MEHRSETIKVRATKLQEDKGKEIQIEVDRISHLPDPIIHHVLSLLPTRYAARTSVLSHRWNSLLSTFPEIVISDLDFSVEGHYRFIDFLLLTLTNRNMINLDLFKISTFRLVDLNEVNEVIGLLVEKSLRGKLRNLDLKFQRGGHNASFDKPNCDTCYMSPPELFSFGQTLLSLNLQGCDFGRFDDNLSVRFDSLKTLSIRDTHIHRVLLEKVIHSSFVLESLDLWGCHGLKGFKIVHYRMRKLVLAELLDLDEFTIDTPSLQYFNYKGYIYSNENGDKARLEFNPSNDALKFPSLIDLYLTCFIMNSDTLNKMLSRCSKVKFMQLSQCDILERSRISGNELTKLVFEDCIFGEKLDFRSCSLETITFKNRFNYLVDFSNKFTNLSSISFIKTNILTCGEIQLAVSSCHQLRSLVIVSCDGLESIEILSKRLEYLVISDCVNVKEVRILAHRLMFLKYIGHTPMFSGLFTSNNFVAELEVKCNIWSQHLEKFHLKEFLQMLSRCAESITLTCHCVQCLNMLKNSSDPSSLCIRDLPKVTASLRVMDSWSSYGAWN